MTSTARPSYIDAAVSFGLFLALMALVAALQWQGGAYRVEPGEHGDEPGHLVTGLMVRDWVLAGFPQPALRFAEDYYLHYPRVTIGHWPPFFYIVQAAWTLIFPAARDSLLLLMAALTAILCLRTAQAVRRHASAWAAPCAALLLLSIPPVVVYSRMVMAEVLLSWLCLETVLAFTAWMDTPGWRRGWPFVLWAAAACLTKVTAVWLAPMVGLTILFSGRWKLLTEKSLWGCGVMVALLTLPWYLYAPGALHQASPDHQGVISAAKSVPSMRLLRRCSEALEMFGVLWSWMGPLLLAALYGLGVLWRRGQTIGPAVAASLIGMAIMRFAVLAAAFEDRTVMPVVALLMVCAAGAVPLLRRFPFASATAVVSFAAWNLLEVPPKTSQHVESAVRATMRPEYRDAIVLVAGDSFREGAFIAAAALGESRPGHTILRSSKIMASSTWNLQRYRLLVNSTTEAMALLERIPVGLLIVESDPRRWRYPHLRLMAETIVAHRSRLRLIESGPMLVYEVTGYRDRPHSPVSIFMYGLGRSLSYSH